MVFSGMETHTCRKSTPVKQEIIRKRLFFRGKVIAAVDLATVFIALAFPASFSILLALFSITQAILVYITAFLAWQLMPVIYTKDTFDVISDIIFALISIVCSILIIVLSLLIVLVDLVNCVWQ